MDVIEVARKLVREGRPQEAVSHVEAAADQGDEGALITLATWRIFGVYGEQDVALAHRLLEKAAAAGSIEALHMRANLIANGTGCTAEPATAAELLSSIADRDSVAREQVELFTAMAPAEEACLLPAEPLCDEEPVRLVRGLLSREECRYLCIRAAPYLQRSVVIDPRTGQQIPNPIRTSDGMNFGPTQEDLVINALNRRVAAVTETSVECGEPLHILRYAPSQEYRPHHDALPGVANQRQATALIYLNSDYRGGETKFPELGVTAKGETGDALIFRNVDEQGMPNRRMRHAGLPVTSGVKWLATRWIRTSAFDPLRPEI